MDHKSRGLLGRLNCKIIKLGTFIYIPYRKIRANSEHRNFFLQQQISDILTYIWYQNVRNNQRNNKKHLEPDCTWALSYRLSFGTIPLSGFVSERLSAKAATKNKDYYVMTSSTAAILDLMQPEVGPIDPPSPKTLLGSNAITIDDLG